MWFKMKENTTKEWQVGFQKSFVWEELLVSDMSVWYRIIYYYLTIL